MNTSSGRNGQATVEFLIGLVAILALFAGLIQVVSLTKARTDTMVAARREAGMAAIAPGSSPMPPDYRRFIQEGADTKRYTKDDTFTPADPARFVDVIVTPAAPDASGWTIIDSLTDNNFSLLHESQSPVEEFGLVSGSAERNILLLPAVRHLLYAAPQITVKSKVWMAKTKDIY